MYDTIIVGAGLAGLQAATTLSAAGKDIVVLEARDRVGGRVENIALKDGRIVEMGGQWVSPGHEKMHALIDAQGLQTVEPGGGDMVLRLGGKAKKIHVEQPAAQDDLSPFEFSDLGQALLRLRRLARKVTDNPTWAAANDRWLGQSLQQWQDVNLRTEGGRRYFARLVEKALGIHPEITTLEDALQRVSTGVDLESYVVTSGGVRQARVVGGLAQLTDEMARDLGDRIRLSTPVTRVEHAEGHVIVTCEGGDRFEGSSLVLTTPPRLLKTIDFEPDLPAERYDMADKIPAGNVIKAFLVYDEPWWRDRGLSGQMSWNEGAMRITFDTSDDEHHGILLGFFEGGEASGYGKLSVSLRQRIFEEAIERAFGPAPRKPVDYVDRDWLAEKYTQGCHAAHFAPGLWTAAGPVIGQPLGSMYFAGAEYASTFNGYMEGAVRSADAATSAILDVAKSSEH
ncbi:flavin monoamine oxidase family protein [Cutibacterium granulosum]|uniref:flavin monoamine oxidase family protein n=1 Tax=Cutibacterium granulosum TaxID=33011 RepID=UPI000DB231FE|nr:FAD-dependent oxidoreductase [Cutibacterium granulosum]MDU6339318.1 FAD-dependent oxidoreductase [Cutibacterium granulosum]MEA5644090.1 FAD-dependent oxidoreductase [Cutibacterium granulosum]PZP25101.1 MAG: amine oxidase [Cutibacterium granulosum]